MKKTIVTLFAALSLIVLGPALSYGTAYAACGSGNTAKEQVLEGVGQTGSNCNDKDIPNVISAVVKILSYVVGVVAIIVVILSGFRYITSGGDANKVGAAKNSLIYALVGLFIAAIAQLLVRFVLFQSSRI